MNRRPNIFDFATSELSQDAFIAWLITWADPIYREVDSALNACAVSFIQELLGKDKSFTVESIEVGRQRDKIDVWSLVNERYYLIIEDKKGAKEENNQLARYAELSKKHYEHLDVEIKLIYFKMEEQGNFKIVEEAGFTLFNRDSMLSVLEEYINTTKETEQNDILIDYHKNLVELNDKIKSYLTLPLQEWHWYSWQGFYSALQKHFDGDWRFVSNPSGGFLGFNWNWKYGEIEGKKFEYYLQLEQSKLVYKLCAYEKTERSEIRENLRKHLFQQANKKNIAISRFGRLGTYMGIAKLNSDYRVTDKKGLLDLEATVEILKDCMCLMDELEKEINKQNDVLQYL